jgi:hypothetical protein
MVLDELPSHQIALNAHEIAMRVVALKHWRAKRHDIPSRHNDPVLPSDTVSVLLAKLESQLIPSMTPTPKRLAPIASKRSTLRALRR